MLLVIHSGWHCQQMLFRMPRLVKHPSFRPSGQAPPARLNQILGVTYFPSRFELIHRAITSEKWISFDTVVRTDWLAGAPACHAQKLGFHEKAGGPSCLIKTQIDRSTLDSSRGRSP